MPDKSKKLTSEQREVFVNWINSKAKNHQCPVCGENDWRLGDHVIHALAQEPLVEGRVYPQVFLSCNNCLFVRHFLAIPMGVVEKVDEEEMAESEEDSDG